MAHYAASPNVTKLKKFLNNIQAIGVPNTVDTTWLARVGVKNRQDGVLPVLKFLGFVSGTSVTQVWLDYRIQARSREVMAEAVRAAYKELFDLHPNAARRPEEELRTYFAGSVTGGQEMLRRTVGTFQALCELSDFDSTAPGSHWLLQLHN